MGGQTDRVQFENVPSNLVLIVEVCVVKMGN